MTRNVVFVAPFPSDITMRFVRAAAKLADVNAIVQTITKGEMAVPSAAHAGASPAVAAPGPPQPKT